QMRQPATTVPVEISDKLPPERLALAQTMRLTPEWNASRRELRYQGQVIKHYRVPAENQELILSAFQEEGWPHCIDDPLPQDGEVDPKQRLQATIKSLNRNQLVRLIRFHGNGNGSQVYWEFSAKRTRGRAV